MKLHTLVKHPKTGVQGTVLDSSAYPYVKWDGSDEPTLEDPDELIVLGADGPQVTESASHENKFGIGTIVEMVDTDTDIPAGARGVVLDDSSAPYVRWDGYYHEDQSANILGVEDALVYAVSERKLRAVNTLFRSTNKQVVLLKGTTHITPSGVRLTHENTTLRITMHRSNNPVVTAVSGPASGTTIRIRQEILRFAPDNTEPTPENAFQDGDIVESISTNQRGVVMCINGDPNEEPLSDISYDVQWRDEEEFDEYVNHKYLQPADYLFHPDDQVVFRDGESEYIDDSLTLDSDSGVFIIQDYSSVPDIRAEDEDLYDEDGDPVQPSVDQTKLRLA